MEAENDKMKSTGERIKALLNEKKMTQRQLAEFCPVCGATWRRKTRCKLVRDSDLFYCKRCEVELKVRVIGGK